MNNDLDSLGGERYHLTDEERSRMRETVKTYMAAHSRVEGETPDPRWNTD
jgi:hypothetical protein